MDTRVAAGGTLIRRYALALTTAGAGIEAAVTAASGPPLSGGPDIHGSAAAAHGFTIDDSVGEPAADDAPEDVGRVGLRLGPAIQIGRGHLWRPPGGNLWRSACGTAASKVCGLALADAGGQVPRWGL